MEYLSKEDANVAFRKALRKTRFNFFDRENKRIKEFKTIEKEEELTNKIYLGVREIPIDKIIGTVEKAEDFDKDFNPTREDSRMRWVSVYMKYLESGSLPLVILYKVRDEYYVYDGNHRVSVAKSLNFHSVDAEVYEFFSSRNDELDIISRERFSFERETDLKNIDCSTGENYNYLRDELKKFGDDYSLEDIYSEKCKVWYQRIFVPVINILISNFKDLENKSNGDIFIDYLKYKNSYTLGNKYQRGYTNVLIDYINRNKILLIKGLETDVKIDSFLIDDFRKLYYIDKMLFYTNDTKGKVKAIREYTKRRFRRETLIIGEIALFNLNNDSHGFIVGMQRWFDNIYKTYKDEILNKSKQLNINLENLDLDSLAEDCVRYSRIYRKKHNRLLTTMEIIYSYLLDIYLPILVVFEENNIEKNLDINAKYFKISQSYLYYTRYGGDKNLRDFIEMNILDKDEIKLGEFVLSQHINFNFDLDKEMINCWSLKNYGGTQNYETLFKLKEYANFLHITDVDEKNKRFIEDIERLIKNREILIQYNNNRIFNIVKGKWDRYTFIDYYASLV